ncbi:hypothetical protein OSB04_014045 [Centaurea solstitialis]|uniref:Uncharacterized protein n=1 Tax=Centaurea solstitialis TaxID=347529 RepID=A0AA38WRL3_9ASTR|nr:hypothetical protein OSB04_014045 [Centaurea solstitialis]
MEMEVAMEMEAAMEKKGIKMEAYGTMEVKEILWMMCISLIYFGELSPKEFEHLRIPLESIKLATNNFGDDNYISRGGFRKVYKGELVRTQGEVIVAVKHLDPTLGQGTPEFWK